MLCLSVCRGASYTSSYNVVSLRLLGFLTHPPRHDYGCGPVDLRRNLAPLVAHRTRCQRLIFIRIAGWTLCWLRLTASAVPLIGSMSGTPDRRLSSLLALSAVAAPSLRWRLLLRPSRGIFIALQHANVDHRELQQLLLEYLVVDSFVGQLSLLCKFAHSSVFSFHSSSCCLSCCIQQSTRVPRSRLAKRCRSVSADRRLRSSALLVQDCRQEGHLFLCSSRSFWSTFTRSQASSNGFVCLTELQHPIRGDDLCHLRQLLDSTSCT